MAETPADCVPIIDMLMKRGGTVAIDTETTGLDRQRDEVLFWSMATEDSRWCFPAKMLPFFDPLFARSDVTWALANAKYDMHLLKNMGINLTGQCEDIFIQDCLLDDTRRHGLKEQSWLQYEAKWGDFKQLFLDPVIVSQVLGMDKDMARKFKAMNTGEKLLHVYKEDPHMVVEYASCDAFFTYMLWEQHNAALASEELGTEVAPGFGTLLDYFKVIEAPLTRVLFKMERRGANIDADYLKAIDEPMRDGIRALEKELSDLAGYSHNPNSHDQVRRVLYDDDRFGLKAGRYTKSAKGAKASTDEKSIEILLDRMEPGRTAARYLVKLQEHRKLAKLHKTYVKGITRLLGPDGKLHTDFKQFVARTGRFSSGNPNLQNMPRPDSDPYKIRGAFIPSPGNWLVDKDYPQIEFRVAAVNAGDTRMMEAIRKGWDIHNANTANMFGLDYDAIAAAKGKHKEDLTQEERHLLIKRQESKAVGLGALFGEGARKMASQLGISLNAAYKLKDQFFNTYPDIEENIAFMHEFAHVFEYTYTMLGRKRRMYKINNEFSNWLVAEEERQAYNTSVQGSAAELVKLAMLRIDADPLLEEMGSYLTLTVHDELVMEAPKALAADTSDLMHDHMADPLHWGPIDLTYPVPIPPDGDIGYRWSDCH